MKYPFNEKLAEQEFKNIFSTKKKPFWALVSLVGTTIGGVIGVALYQNLKKRKLKEHYFDIPSNVSALEIGSGIELSLSFGAKPCLIVETTQRRLKDFFCDLRGTCLKIYMMPNQVDKKNPIHIRISLPYLHSISLTGNSKIFSDGTNEVSHFQLKQQDAEIAGLIIQADRISISLTGNYSSNLAMLGGALEGAIYGSGNALLDTHKCDLNLRVAGDGIVYLMGESNNLDLHLSGNSRLKGEDLNIGNAKIHFIDKAEGYINKMDRASISLQDNSFLKIQNPIKKRENVEVLDNASLLFANK